jgi:hypothetical protein
MLCRWAEVSPSGGVKEKQIVERAASKPNNVDGAISLPGNICGNDHRFLLLVVLGEPEPGLHRRRVHVVEPSSRTFNSISNPLPIDPTILFTLSQDASFNLTGSATIMNSPCISSLTLSGRAIGGAFSVADAGNEAVITALPGVNSLNFSYNSKSTVEQDLRPTRQIGQSRVTGGTTERGVTNDCHRRQRQLLL